MKNEALETRPPTRAEIAELLYACLISHSGVVAPGSSRRRLVSVERTNDGFRTSAAWHEANQIALDDDESVLGLVDVSLESDRVDWSDWNHAENTENEDGARDVAQSGYQTYDEYTILA